MRPLWKKIAGAAGAFVATLAAGELGVRCASSPPFDAHQARAAALRTVESLSGNRWGPRLDGDVAPADEDQDTPEFRLHPYTGFDIGDSDLVVESDAESFARQRAEGRVDIAVLGGSVAAGFAKDGHRILQQRLEALPAWQGRRVRVYNCGRGGFRQPQQLHLLEYLLEVGYRPDIVVELDGFNEVALGLQNARAGVHPIMPSVSHWAHLASNAPPTPRMLDQIVVIRAEQLAAARTFARAEALGLFHSAIASRMLQSTLDGGFARYAEASRLYEEELQQPGARSYLVGPKFDPTDEAVLDTCVDIWIDSSLSMDAICRLHGIRYVQLLQPTLHDEGSKPVTETERRVGAQPEVWAQGARKGYPKLRARAPELVARGVEYVDLSRAFASVETDLYYDICHFAPAGNQQLAETVAAVLGALPPPAPTTPTAVGK